MEFPFLYCTRTILRAKSRPKVKVVLCPLTPCRSLSGLATKGQGEDYKQLYYEKAKKRRTAANEPSIEIPEIQPIPPSTLTDFERHNFVHLAHLAQQSQYRSQATEPHRLSTDIDVILNLFPAPREYHQRQPKQDEGESLSDGSGLDSTNTLFTPFQQSLDSLAQQGQQHLNQIARSQQTTKSVDTVTEICRHQLNAYNKLFHRSLVDKHNLKAVAVYDILQEHVFPLVQFINPKPSSIPHHTPPPSPPSPPSASTSPSLSTPASASAATPPTKPSSTTKATPNLASLLQISSTAASLPPKRLPTKLPALLIVSRLYPAAILLALRLLVKHDPTSPLTSSLLTSIRGAGATSYVLAANTHFYNTFLLLRWNLFSSLSELCSLLAEMERGVIEFDSGTLKFLNEVVEERARDLYLDARGEKVDDDRSGTRGAEWWKQDMQRKYWPRLHEWKELMARRLDEKGEVDVVAREGPYSRLQAQEIEEGAYAGEQVWL